KLEASIQSAKEAQHGLAASLAEHDEALAKLRAAGSALKQRDHERRVEQVKLVQSDERYRERSGQIAEELAEIAAQQSAEHEAKATAAEALERHQQDIEATRASLLEVSAAHEAAA